MPSSPAVYGFVDGEGSNLYIGKSIHLRTRIRQHLKAAQEGEKQHIFWDQAKSLTYYQVSSELEALLLEARLIRLYQPLYNAISRDDKSDLYIVVTQDQYPRVKLARKTELKHKDEYFGPFMSAQKTQQILRFARKIFHFCANPPLEGRVGRQCFYYHLNQCDGACVGKVSAKDYKRKISLLKRFLNGQTQTVIARLARQIRGLSKIEDYRQAAKLKRAFEALVQAQTSLKFGGSFLESNPHVDRQLGRLVTVLKQEGINLSPVRIECYDMATLGQKQTIGSMVVFSLGVADKSQYRRFRVRHLSGGDPHNMAEVITRRFKHREWPSPSLVVLDGGKGQLSVAGSKVPANIPVIALAKKEETVFYRTSGGFETIKLPHTDPALKLLQSIRDEAHRFGTRYHAQIRRREFLSKQ